MIGNSVVVNSLLAGRLHLHAVRWNFWLATNSLRLVPSLYIFRVDPAVRLAIAFAFGALDFGMRSKRGV